MRSEAVGDVIGHGSIAVRAASHKLEAGLAFSERRDFRSSHCSEDVSPSFSFMCLQKDQRTVYREEYEPALKDVQGSNSYIKSTEVHDIKQHLSPSSLIRKLWKMRFRS